MFTKCIVCSSVGPWSHHSACRNKNKPNRSCRSLKLMVNVGSYVVHTAEARSYGGRKDLTKRLLSAHFGALLGSRVLPVVSTAGVVVPFVIAVGLVVVVGVVGVSLVFVVVGVCET